MTADELARVTAERDAARDEVIRLDAELTGVRASLVEQAEDAEDARAVVAIRTEELREAQALLAGYRQDLNEQDAAVAALGRVEALATRLELAWWNNDGTSEPRVTVGSVLRDLDDALRPGSTRDGSASPEDPVAGAREADWLRPLLDDQKRQWQSGNGLHASTCPCDTCTKGPQCESVREPYRCIRTKGHAERHESYDPNDRRCFWLDDGDFWWDAPPVPMPTWDRNGPTGEAMQ